MSASTPSGPQAPAENSDGSKSAPVNGVGSQNGGIPHHGVSPAVSSVSSLSAGATVPAAPSVPDAAPAAGPGSLPAPSRKVLTMKRPFRLGEMLIERSIQGIAFISLLFITLIFVFVFKEAFPLFTSHPPITKAESEVGASESYGDDASAPTVVEAPELATTEREFKSRDLVVKDWQPVSLEPKYGLPPLLRLSDRHLRSLNASQVRCFIQSTSCNRALISWLSPPRLLSV